MVKELSNLMYLASWIFLLVLGCGFGFVGRALAAEITVVDSIRKYRFKAKNAREKNDYDEALQFYREYLKYESDEKRIRQAYYFIGKIHFEKEEFEAAKLALRRTVALDSLYVNPNLTLYQIYLHQSLPDSAAQCLERVVQARPGKTQHRRKLADLYRRQNRTQAAIRHYVHLAEKTGKLMPSDIRGRKEVMEWLTWQMSGMGPMFGQAGHFRFYAPDKIPYALERYHTESLRLYGVLNQRLEGSKYICGDYSIADIACWPWVLTYKKQKIDLGQFPNVRRWYDLLKTRPGLRRGYEVGKEFGKPDGKWDDEARKHLMPRAR